MKRLLRLAAAVTSGVMLALSFEPFGYAEMAWFALVPAVLAFRFARSGKGAAGLGFLCGLTCWMVSLYWFQGLAKSQEAGLFAILGGQFALSTWCALYFIPLALLSYFWFRRFDGNDKGANMVFIYTGAALWVGFEWLRSVLFSGFAWNTLAISQYQNLAAIQVSSLAGVYAVSFLVMLLNLGLATTVQRYMVRTDRKLGWHPEVVLPMLLLAAALAYGIQSLHAERLRASGYSSISATLIQPNISQYEKWDDAFAREILHTMYLLTVDAHEKNKSDLIVWPETALPDHWRYETPYLSHLLDLTETPMLVGSIHYTDEELRIFEFKNGSFLFHPDEQNFVDDPLGSPPQYYDKQHLVMFGESVPFRKVLPILRKLTPVQFYCIPGEESTVLELGDPADTRFSPLICFEDVMPYLSRNAVRNGARLLINQTNDAWFDPYPAADQHMPHAVFRAVEHRVPVIRATNTGRSCVIDTTGMLTQHMPRLEKTWMRAPKIAVPPDGHPLTLYGRVGDWPAIACFVLGLVAMLLLMRNRTSPLEG